jgi:hypothetical protein
MRVDPNQLTAETHHLRTLAVRPDVYSRGGFGLPSLVGRSTKTWRQRFLEDSTRARATRFAISEPPTV